MSSEWRASTWGEISKLEYGKAIRGYQEAKGKYPVYGTNGQIGWHDKSLSAQPGVIIGRKGAYRGIHYSDKPFFVIDTAFYLVPKNQINIKWAYYCLLTYDINRMDSGSAIPSTSREEFYKLPVKIPSLAEQQSIAGIVEPLDDRIALLRETNATLESIAQAIFKSWFIEFDAVKARQQGQEPQGMDAATAALFPDAFQDSELGPIPAGWEVGSVYDLAQYVNGAAYKAFEPNLEQKGLPIIKIAELKAGVTSQTAYSEVNMPSKYRIATRDILFSWSGNPDTSIDIFLWLHGDAWLNQHIFRVIPKVEQERSFVYLTLKTLKPVFSEIARNKQTTGLGHVTVSDLKCLKIIRPNNVLLQEWNKIIDPLLEQAFVMQQKIQTLASIRDTLLPRLISGRLRLPEAEAMAGEVGL
ncbi:restriction endonuclease subunit S [Chlorobaculum thiosulfatiphilum]|nr:restriction endonuclease subunit S [Chlorobaculum thiosulfatiphilum]